MRVDLSTLQTPSQTFYPLSLTSFLYYRQPPTWNSRRSTVNSKLPDLSPLSDGWPGKGSTMLTHSLL